MAGPTLKLSPSHNSPPNAEAERRMRSTEQSFTTGGGFLARRRNQCQ